MNVADTIQYKVRNNKYKVRNKEKPLVIMFKNKMSKNITCMQHFRVNIVRQVCNISETGIC
jgi:hypothetical protein